MFHKIEKDQPDVTAFLPPETGDMKGSHPTWTYNLQSSARTLSENYLKKNDAKECGFFYCSGKNQRGPKLEAVDGGLKLSLPYGKRNPNDLQEKTYLLKALINSC